MDRNDNFFFPLMLSLSCPVMALKEGIFMLFIFFLIFFLFFEIPYSEFGWNGTEQEFFLSHSQPHPSRFGLERSHIDVFKFF